MHSSVFHASDFQRSPRFLCQSLLLAGCTQAASHPCETLEHFGGSEGVSKTCGYKIGDALQVHVRAYERTSIGQLHIEGGNVVFRRSLLHVRAFTCKRRSNMKRTSSDLNLEFYE